MRSRNGVQLGKICIVSPGKWVLVDEQGRSASTWRRVRANPALAASRFRRAEVIAAIRGFFRRRGFHEVDTPLFVRSPGMEPQLDAFATTWHTPTGEAHPGFLTTSPEYSMKKLLAAGIAPIYQICKSFRNGEGLGSRHNPEFTILEWYRADADYHDLMSDCQDLLRSIAGDLDPATTGSRLRYQGQSIDLEAPWDRLSVADAFKRFAEVDIWETELPLAEAARQHGYDVSDDTTWEQAFNQVFLNEIEPRLGLDRPTILYDYPVSMAALSRRSSGDPRVAERFELYIAGIELANAFSELIDPTEQLERLTSEQDERRALGKAVYDIDDDFIRALSVGLPRSAGIALGVDRLAMLFADVTSIRDVLWFPADDIFS